MELRFLSLILLFTSVNGASILALFSSLSYTDHLIFRGYVSLLASRGHSVAVMTPYPGHFQPPARDQIIELDVSAESHPFWEEYTKLVNNVEDPYSKLKELNDLKLKVAIAQIRSKQMTALLMNPTIKFDLVITEADVPFLYGAVDKYLAPHIAITTTTGKLNQYQSKNAPTHPILYPDVHTLNFGNLNIWQKVTEIKRNIQTTQEYENGYLQLSDFAAKSIFDLNRSLSEIEKDIDLLVVANNPVLTGNRPTGSSVVFADRMHLTPGNLLPENFLNFLNSATKGVIYFSVGVIQPAEQLSTQLLETLADAFRELPYTVLWKIGNTSAINLPENVVAQEWFPQQEILAHPNVKCFITHGGSRSIEEAVFYQVPIIGLPIVKTRKVFIEQVTKHGAGEILDPHYLDKETLSATISVVASDQKYKDAIVTLSKAVFDPIVSGPDHAVLWTEYVLRNGGARLLRSPSASFIETYLLDVLFFFVLGGLLLIVAAYIIARRIIAKIRRRLLERSGIDGKYKSL